MIIQKALKGISGITRTQAQAILDAGILCNWWRTIGTLPAAQIPLMLTKRNLDWHQNKYAKSDPTNRNQAFSVNTPFISVTAGTVHYDKFTKNIDLTPAWKTALKFATKSGRTDGWIFYCYVFILGQKTIEHQSFSEEVRELNIYNIPSPYHYQGEITAKIIIPPAQISRCDFFTAKEATEALDAGVMPKASLTIYNNLYQIPEAISNIREPLA
jgi:hypothetical protein